MTVLVTGATGPVGRLLVMRLQAEGRSVRVLTRRPFRASALFSSVEAVEWHPNVEAPPASVFEGVNAVIHLLGAPVAARPYPGATDRFAASRTAATARLAEGLAGRSWRLVLASVAPSSADAAGVLTEASPAPAKPSEAWSAVLAAEAAGQAARTAGASVAIVRLGCILSDEGIVARLAADAAQGFVASLHGARIPAIDPEDAAGLLAGLVDRADIEGVLHGVAPEPLPGEALTALLAALSPLPLPIPLGARALARRHGMAAPMLLGRARVVPQRLVEIGAAFMHPSPLPRAERLIERLFADHAMRQPWWRRLAPRAGAPEPTA